MTPTVIPRLFTADIEGLVNFIRKVLGGVGEIPPGAPAQLQIGDSLIMVSDGGGAVRQFGGAFLYVYVPDTDAAFRTACALGAEVIEEPADQFYGDRRATVRDPWGNRWQIATPKSP